MNEKKKKRAFNKSLIFFNLFFHLFAYVTQFMNKKNWIFYRGFKQENKLLPTVAHKCHAENDLFFFLYRFSDFLRHFLRDVFFLFLLQAGALSLRTSWSIYKIAILLNISHCLLHFYLTISNIFLLTLTQTETTTVWFEYYFIHKTCIFEDIGIATVFTAKVNDVLINFLYTFTSLNVCHCSL